MMIKVVMAAVVVLASVGAAVLSAPQSDAEAKNSAAPEVEVALLPEAPEGNAAQKQAPVEVVEQAEPAQEKLVSRKTAEAVDAVEPKQNVAEPAIEPGAQAAISQSVESIGEHTAKRIRTAEENAAAATKAAQEAMIGHEELKKIALGLSGEIDRRSEESGELRELLAEVRREAEAKAQQAEELKQRLLKDAEAIQERVARAEEILAEKAKSSEGPISILAEMAKEADERLKEGSSSN